MQITYNNKQTLQNNPSIPNENKVTAENMNEIKSVVNANDVEQQALIVSVAQNRQDIDSIMQEQTEQNERLNDLETDNVENKENIQSNTNSINSLNNALNTEKTARENADNNLQTSINTTNNNLSTLRERVTATETDISNIKTEQIAQNTAINNKVNKVPGKGLSTNDYDNTEQSKVTANTNARHTHSNKSILDETTASFTEEEKTKLAGLSNYDDTELSGKVSANESDISNIKTEQTIQNSNITALQEENAELKDKLEKTRNNQLTNTATGTSIDLDDSANDYVRSLTLKRNTTQKTTVGRNLLPTIPAGSRTNYGITLTSNGDGSFTVVGTAIATGDIYFTLENPVQLPDQDIYVHLRNSQIINNFSALFYGGGRSSSPSFSVENRILTSANLTDMNLSNIGVHVNVGLEVNTTFTPSFELTDEETDFEEYTGGQPSPSPQFPQPIKNVGDNINIVQTDSNSWEQGSVHPTTGELTSSTTRIRLKEKMNIKSNTTYTYKVHNTNYKFLNADFYDNSNNFITSATTLLNVSNFDGYESVSLTTPANANKMLVIIRKNDNSTIVASEIETAKFKVEEGTIASGFSNFNSGVVNEKVVSKNFLQFINQDFTVNNVNYYVKNGSLYMNGTSTSETSTTNVKFKNNFSFILTQGTYYLNRGAVLTNLGVTLALKKYSDNSNLVQNSGSFTINEDTKVYLGFYIYQKVFDDVLIDVQLEKGSTATIYVPHHEQSVNFPMQTNQKLLGYTADDGIHQECKQMVLDGSQLLSKFLYNANLSTTDYSCFIYNDNDIPQAKNDTEIFVYADKLIGTPSNERTFNKLNCWINHLASNNLGFHVPKTITTVQELRTWLTENPITFQVPIENEQIETYSQEQQTAYSEMKELETYKTVTHIYSEDETKANMDLEYVQDTKTYIDNKIETLNDAIVSLGGNV